MAIATGPFVLTYICDLDATMPVTRSITTTNEELNEPKSLSVDCMGRAYKQRKVTVSPITNLFCNSRSRSQSAITNKDRPKIQCQIRRTASMDSIIDICNHSITSQTWIDNQITR